MELEGGIKQRPATLGFHPKPRPLFFKKAGQKTFKRETAFRSNLFEFTQTFSKTFDFSDSGSCGA